ncbi:MAG: hypothetical protein ACUVWR_00970 [Anaerolineae bacterium]
MSSSRCPDKNAPSDDIRVGIVGVCGAGKSTLAASLLQLGYQARQISQEHSYVHNLWCRFWKPTILIYLEASEVTVEARLGHALHPGLWTQQHRRLAHARENCDIYIRTDDLTTDEVLQKVLRCLKARADGQHSKTGEQ